MIRAYTNADIDEMAAVWNEVVEDGVAFPQLDLLDHATAEAFFKEQTYCGVAEIDGRVLGMYILHPNNVGRCGHIANCSYAVSHMAQGRGLGKALVADSMEQAKAHGFRIIQFNAVVRTNMRARHIYEELGFVPLGAIPGGFLMKDGRYEDIIPMYRTL